MLVRVASVASLFVGALLICQGDGLVQAQEFSYVPFKEISQFTQARDRSQQFRREIDELAEAFRQESKTHLQVSQELVNQVSAIRREYFALREIYFRFVFKHASGIVERIEDYKQKEVLLRTSLCLAAGTEMVKNFHQTGAAIISHPTLRDRWDEPDPLNSIPRDSWIQLLGNAQKPAYRDIFRAGLERLRENESDLEDYWEAGDDNFRAIYPEGIEFGVQEMEKHFQLFNEDLIEDYSREDEQELQFLVEQSKTVRALWARRAPQFREAIDRDNGMIRGEVRLEIYQAQKSFLSLRESLFRLAFKHLPKLTRKDIPYPPEHRLRGIGISLLAAVTLYENAQVLINQILVVPEIRVLLNQGDPVLGIPSKFWDGMEKEFVKFKYRELVETGLVEFEVLYRTLQESLIDDDAFLRYVRFELARNPMVAELLTETDFEQLTKALGVQINQAIDFFMGNVMGVKYTASKRFVNLMGVVELRKGKLYGQTYWEEFVKARLKPGDILLEKSPFRLTERMVPGYFAHAALYVGKEEDLSELELLSYPHIRQHLSDISEGRNIVEALREGTKLSSVQSFLDIDDLAILRPKPNVISQKDVREAIKLAFSHLGKKYDFNFDTNTWNVVTCSELIFQSYIRVPWSFGRVFGSYSISPDDIAIFAGSDNARSFSLITFIYKGRLMHDLPTGLHDEDLYIKLLRGRYAEAIPTPVVTSDTE